MTKFKEVITFYLGFGGRSSISHTFWTINFHIILYSPQLEPLKVIIISFCRKFTRRFWADIFAQSKACFLFCHVYSSVWFLADFHIILDPEKRMYKINHKIILFHKDSSNRPLIQLQHFTFEQALRPLHCSQRLSIQQLYSSGDPFGSFAPGMSSFVRQTEAVTPRSGLVAPLGAIFVLVFSIWCSGR